MRHKTFKMYSSFHYSVQSDAESFITQSSHASRKRKRVFINRNRFIVVQCGVTIDTNDIVDFFGNRSHSIVATIVATIVAVRTFKNNDPRWATGRWKWKFSNQNCVQCACFRLRLISYFIFYGFHNSNHTTQFHFIPCIIIYVSYQL